MTASAHVMIEQNTDAFSHVAAQRLRQRVGTTPHGTVVIDFASVDQITTAALAELVLLRRKLLAEGCDLKVANMTGQVAALYRICRLDSVLPTA